MYKYLEDVPTSAIQVCLKYRNKNKFTCGYFSAFSMDYSEKNVRGCKS